MKPLHQSNPEDLAGVQMENNLLIHEIRLLRTRLRSVVNQLHALQSLEDGAAPDLKELKQAHRDVRALAAELAEGSPDWQRRDSVREIVARWTGDGA